MNIDQEKHCSECKRPIPVGSHSGICDCCWQKHLLIMREIEKMESDFIESIEEEIEG